jgi:thioredoxin-like negative regulator of GroEL
VNIRQQEQVPNVTTEKFEQLVMRSSLPVLVNFQTSWSRRMMPLLGQLAEAYAGRLRVVQVNIATAPELAARFKIRAVPTLLIFKKGVPVEFIVGTVPSRFVFETVSKVLSVSPRPARVRGGPKAFRRSAAWQLVFDSSAS